MLQIRLHLRISKAAGAFSSASHTGFRFSGFRGQGLASRSLFSSSRSNGNGYKSHGGTGQRTFTSSEFFQGFAILLPSGCILGLKASQWHKQYQAGQSQAIRGLFCDASLAQTKFIEAKAHEQVSKKSAKELTTLQLLSEIWKHLKPDWLLLTSIVVVTGATAMVNLYIPVVVGELVTVVQGLIASGGATGNALQVLNVPALKLLGLYVGNGLLTFVDITLVTKLGENLARSLRRELFGVLLYQDMAFFDGHMQGEVLSRLTEDVADFKSTFKIVITQIVGAGVQLVSLSPNLTLTLLSTLPILYFTLNFYGSYLRKLSRRAKLGDSESTGVAGEAISNIKTVKAFASEDRELENYTSAISKSSRTSLKLGFHIGLFQGLLNSSIGAMILMILYFGGSLVAKGEMTGGQLMTFMVATQNAQRSLSQIGVLFGQVVKALGSANRIFEYIYTAPQIPTRGGLQLESFKGEIEFVNVEFRYPTRPQHPVLHNFSLKVPVGKIVALCGQSGSGKSTIGQLIERFYEADAGSILIDGVDIRKLDPSWLRNNIGYISQEPILFASTIYENIRYGRPGATREEVEAAARQANAATFIESFPDGYGTVVGERGVTLSGGQKQRIAIARALLKDPRLLILDEATSALDTQSERVVQEALDRLMKDRTVVIIAHRLSTIETADLIVVLNNNASRDTGNVLEIGTHKELMKKRGAYYRLHSMTFEHGGLLG
ncbi:P-loop containing nucleoside triphosphate hydrolase protein [Polychytrium aggregatum]|uniref:P-loop containing nucleoside triphosphate hydrolase protein n=1 Tax=Polychytrium aggregatum TaxID=110093 RepID=UPI0022FF3A27|nr:P-loop containing nucleoside triphosphate hydrolase protein [Polychytrium aggregatum]KAI9206111.1 P-loop containing nucleoside triphosphate hydrolase protein [Polychytrium aggregatum]